MDEGGEASVVFKDTAKLNAILFSASMLEMPAVQSRQEPDRSKWFKSMINSHVQHGQKQIKSKSKDNCAED